MQARFLK